MKADLIINHNGVIQYPAVEEGIDLTWERKGMPGKLDFTVVKDGVLNFQEGDPVRLTVDGTDIFYGYAFIKKRSKNPTISVTAYDQLRYLKNKDTYVYSNKTASEVVAMLAEDFNLKTGELADTGYKIATRTEDNTTLFDIIQNALDETLTARNKLYVLYDDVGALMLRDIESMKLDLLIDPDTLGDFDYKSSIDDQTYDQIKLIHEDSDSGKRSVYTAKDVEHIDQWGVLQLTDKLQEPANGQAMADGLLLLHNTKTRTLSVSDVLGDLRVRGGSSVIVKLNLGDILVQNYFVVENVKHTFNQNQHLMSLKLRGGTFIA